MSKKKVLLTGAGGAALPYLITHLRERDFAVYAADMDKYAAGLYLADKGVIIPAGASTEFFPKLQGFCERENIDAVVPLVDEELLSSIDIEGNGLQVILPRKAFISLCLDKYRLMRSMQQAGLTVPLTELAARRSMHFPFPVIAKPRVGRGSRGVRLLSCAADLAYFYDNESHLDDYIIQEYIDGPEYTVSVVAWRDGGVQAVVPKEIISKKGITRLAVTRHNLRIDQLCRKIQALLHADGPFNVQLRLNQTGEPFVFEINPRFSTSITLTIAAGVDEITMLLDQALHGSPPTSITDWKEGVVMLRQTADNFIEESVFIHHFDNMGEL